MFDKINNDIEKIQMLFMKIMPQIQGKMLKPKNLFFSGEMTISEVKTLSFFRDKKKYKMSDLANAAFIPLPTATHIVDKLVKSGFLKRGFDEKDRRVITVEITEKGTEVIQEHTKCHRDGTKEFFNMLDAKDQKRLIKVIGDFADVMEDVIGKMNKKTIRKGKEYEKI